MDLGLKDKTAVVTASSKGLGRAVAEALAREGSRLVLCARDGERLRAAGEEIGRAYGTEVHCETCDVQDRAGVEAFARAVLERYGGIHVLFMNAGGPPAGGLDDVRPEDFEKALSLNLMSAIYLAYAFIPSMREQKWGRIIASTSITVKQPVPALALSNVSRVGVVAFVKSLAYELGPFNITANAVAPGYIMTDRVVSLFQERTRKENITLEQARRSVEESIPAGRIGKPEEFGALVAFLASEQASYINGETILIDGGMYRGLM